MVPTSPSFNGVFRWSRPTNVDRAPERRVARSAVDADFTAAKAELIRLRVAEKKRELIPLEFARGVEDKAIGAVLTAMAGMAARCAGYDLQLRRKIDQVV